MLADLYHPHLSGVTIHIDQLKRYLEGAGHQVWTFTFGPRLPQDAAHRIVRSPPLPVAPRYGGKRLHLGARLSRSAREKLDSMDLIHAHHPFISGWLGTRRAKRRQPLVFTAHTRYDLHLAALAPRPFLGVGQVLLRSYLRWFCPRCSLVLAPSRAMRQRLEGWKARGRFQVIPHGIDLEAFAGKNGLAQRRRLGLPEDAKVLIFVGRLGREKDLDVLLEVLEALSLRWSGLRLLLVGDGPERARLERRRTRLQAPDSVGLLGTCPPQEIPALLAAADLFVTASRSEVFPLSVIEAQAAGLPVVGFRAPGLNDIVADGHSGLLARSRRGLKESISRLLEDRSLRRRMSRNARVRSRHFALESMGSRTLQAYLELLNSERPALKSRAP